MLPNFIIIGAQKAGTTALYHYLKQHPAIFLPDIKEPHFFSTYNNRDDYIIKGRKRKKISSLEEYEKLFSGVRYESAIGEASPSYLYNAKTPKLINQIIPNVKLIAIFRNPIDRAYSNYNHALRDGREPLKDFRLALKEERSRRENNWSPLYHYISKGLYSIQLERYFKIFTKKRILVLFHEDFLINPNLTLKVIFNYLSVDPSFTPVVSKKHNVGGIPKKSITGNLIKQIRTYRLLPIARIKQYLPEKLKKIVWTLSLNKPEDIPSDLKAELIKKYFLEDIKSLEKLIDTDLSNWYT